MPSIGPSAEGTPSACCSPTSTTSRTSTTPTGTPSETPCSSRSPERLKGVVRTDDTVARLGGDEFGILVEELDIEHDGEHAAERIIEVLAEPVVVGDIEVFAHASIGIALGTASGGMRKETTSQMVEKLLIDADLAMHEAKRQGRRGFRYYASSMEKGIKERMAMRSDLERGLSRGEFVLHYQPIVSLDTERGRACRGVVALATPGQRSRSSRTTHCAARGGERAHCRHRTVGTARGMCTSASLGAVWKRENLRHKQRGQRVAPPAERERPARRRRHRARCTRHLDPHTLTLEITESALFDDTEVALERAAAPQRGLGIDSRSTTSGPATRR